MNEKSLTLDVCVVQGTLAPDAEGARLVILGDGQEVVTVNLCAEGLLRMSILMDQMALDLESARLVAGKRVTLLEGPPEAHESPAVTPVHIAHELKAIRTGGQGGLLDVKTVRGEHFRIALQAEQASSLLAGLLVAGVERVQ